MYSKRLSAKLIRRLRCICVNLEDRVSEEMRKYWTEQVEIISHNFLGNYLANIGASIIDAPSAHLVVNLEQSHHLLFIFGSYVYEYSGSKKYSYFSLVVLVRNSEERMDYLKYAFSEKGTEGFLAINSFAATNGIFLDHDLNHSYIDEDLFDVEKVLNDLCKLIESDNGVQLYK